MVFDTLRVGFPTAEVVVTDNCSVPESVQFIEEAAAKAGCQFRRLPERIEHGVFIREVVKSSKGQVVFVDTDMAFWDNCEDLKFRDALFAGMLVPECDAIGAKHTARIHPSLLFVTDCEKLWAECQRLSAEDFYFRPFEAQRIVDGDTCLIADTCSGLWSRLRHKAYVFGPRELDRYSHLFMGTIPDLLGDDPVSEMIRRSHAEPVRGMWRYQSPANTKWTYWSGRADNVFFMLAKFEDLRWGDRWCHSAVVNADTGEYWSGVSEDGRFLNGTVAVDQPDVLSWLDHGFHERPNGGWSRHRSAWPTDVRVSIHTPNADYVGPAQVWVDEETLNLATRYGWRWTSLRYDDGRAYMIYDVPNGGILYVDMRTGERVDRWQVPEPDLIAIAPNQIVSDPVRGLRYQEAAYWIMEDGKRVGYAYIEDVPEDWGQFDIREAYYRWCAGDGDAAQALALLTAGSQLADDIADGDLAGSGPVSELLFRSTISLGGNAWWLKHRHLIEGVLGMAFITWDASDQWAKSKNEQTQMFGYCWREATMQVITMFALITGGLEHARRTMREVHQFYHRGRVESFEQWRNGA